jgi:N-acyl-D-amino-acid deacylase
MNLGLERDMSDLLIRNGTVVDGTGKPGYAADVRISGDRIAEIGKDFQPRAGEKSIDAQGCIVSPGFIEAHTHYDAPMWWQPDLDPLPGNGVTTIITGNCGFTAAPVSHDKEAQLEMVKIFSFFEDIPLEPFLKHLPFDWHTFSEYRKSVEARVKLPANLAIYTGHIALRLTVMGKDAWTRAATPDEIKQMAALLDDAMQAGALGLSDNLLDHDGQNRPIPTLLAEDDEFIALFDVLDRYPGATYQVIIDNIMRHTGPAQTDRMARMLKGRSFRTQIAGAIPFREYSRDKVAPMRARIETMRADGIDVWPGYAHVALTAQISIFKSLLFAQSNDYVWHEVVLAETDEEKAAILRDPDWRARARETWDTKCWKMAPQNNCDRLLLTRIGSDNGAGPFDITLEEYAAQLGVHRSDAMAEWFLANGVRSAVRMAPDALIEDLVLDLMNDPHTVGNISDAGAHQQMLCGGGENILLFTKYVRDLKAVSVEQAVHIQTGKLAGHFNLSDIGEIKVGKRADITVFKLDELQRHDMQRVYDADDGMGGTTWRYSRPAAPMRLTVVGGEVTFDGEKYTGARPGSWLSPAKGEADLQIAAE